MTTVIDRIKRGDKFDAKTKQELLQYVGKLESQLMPNVEYKVCIEIKDRLEHARREHPENTEFASVSAIFEEVDEYDNALLEESPERQRSELLDVVATCIRNLNGEYNG